MCHLSYIDKGISLFQGRKGGKSQRRTREKPTREAPASLNYTLKEYKKKKSRTDDVPRQATTRERKRTSRTVHADTRARAHEMNCARAHVHDAHGLNGRSEIG